MSACFTSHFGQYVFLFAFSFHVFLSLNFYRCLYFHVTSWCCRHLNKQNEIKPGGEEQIREEREDGSCVSALRAVAQLRGAQTPHSSPRSFAAAQTSSSSSSPIPLVRPNDLNKSDCPQTCFTLPLPPAELVRTPSTLLPPDPSQPPSRTESQKAKISAQPWCAIILIINMIGQQNRSTECI